MMRAAFLMTSLASLGAMAVPLANRLVPPAWSDAEVQTLRSLSLASLPPLPPDPSNRFADDPRAAALGGRLFSDPRLSGDGKVSCATCHRADRSFTDGRPTATGMGHGNRNTPSITAAAYGPWYFWDGRRDSQWAQALGPLESPSEQGATRTRLVGVLHDHYLTAYQEIFGTLPDLPAVYAIAASPIGAPDQRRAWAALPAVAQDQVNRAFSNLGKALAAHQRRLRFGESRFDHYVADVVDGNRMRAHLALSADERAGLRLFIGHAGCISCHRGPLLTNHEFFSLGLPFGAAGPDPGRAAAYELVHKDPFNCQGRYSDAPPSACAELRFMANDQAGFLAAFKTPSLRDVAATAPYMHAGQLATLADVVDHYNRAPQVPYPEHSDIRPLGLAAAERAQLVAFLGTLTSPVSPRKLDRN